MAPSEQGLSRQTVQVRCPAPKRPQTILPYDRRYVLAIGPQEHQGRRHIDVRLWAGSLLQLDRLTPTKKGLKLYPETGRAALDAISRALDALETEA